MTKIHKYGDLGVDVKLAHTNTTDDVFWSQRGHSYVLVADNLHGEWVVDGQRVQVISVNGGGEIRWNVHTWDLLDEDDRAAVKYFGARFYKR